MSMKHRTAPLGLGIVLLGLGTAPLELATVPLGLETVLLGLVNSAFVLFFTLLLTPSFSHL